MVVIELVGLGVALIGLTNPLEGLPWPWLSTLLVVAGLTLLSISAVVVLWRHLSGRDRRFVQEPDRWREKQVIRQQARQRRRALSSPQVQTVKQVLQLKSLTVEDGVIRVDVGLPCTWRYRMRHLVVSVLCWLANHKVLSERPLFWLAARLGVNRRRTA